MSNSVLELGIISDYALIVEGKPLSFESSLMATCRESLKSASGSVVLEFVVKGCP